MSAQGVALVLGGPDVLGRGGEEGHRLSVACFCGSELFDQFPDGGWLGCEVDGRYHVAPSGCSVLAEG